ncbi:hypothetical protein NQ314_009320 [Rhamnusium bicolor]|uniref:CRAL-TRIO domain-containing protein n=1 Tax=Rhamnusium bicolor TaxID=1586634 RepID=A0AAV8Y3A1_9CUCU|nr:hypothetical protein NQ314_009320 [Rhamnusium bicolor]
MHYFEPISPTVEEEIWRFWGKTMESVNQDIENLKFWLNLQPHLPHTLSNKQLKAYLLMNRGSVEKTKLKIDMYYTMRTVFPDVFQNSHPLSERLLHATKFIYFLPLPKLCADFSRIVILKIKDVDAMDFDAYAWWAHIINVVEIRLHEDACSGHIVIIDMENYKISYLMKFTPTLFKCIYTIGSVSIQFFCNH